MRVGGLLSLLLVHFSTFFSYLEEEGVCYWGLKLDLDCDLIYVSSRAGMSGAHHHAQFLLGEMGSP
jgi:hypothetical protein